MKYLAPLVFIVSLVLAAVACGDDDDDNDSTDNGDLPEMHIILAQPLPKTHMFGQSSDYFAARVNELSNGKVTVDVHHAGDLVKLGEEITELDSGTVQIASTGWNHHEAELPFLYDAATVPFLYSYDQVPGFLKLAQPTIEQEMLKAGVKPLWHTPLGVELFLCKELKNLREPDLKGFRLRSTGGYLNNLLEEWGATLVSLSSADLPVAIATGQLEGAATSLQSYVASGIAKDCSYPYITEANIAMASISISADYWSELAPNVQEVISQAAKDTQDWVFVELPAQDRKAVVDLQADKAMHVTVLSPDELADWRKAAQPLWDLFVTDQGEMATTWLKWAAEARE